jgi:hypothetical protein
MKISGDKEYFETIFGLLNQNNPEILEAAWTLLSRLPVNTLLEQNLRDLVAVKQAK